MKGLEPYRILKLEDEKARRAARSRLVAFTQYTMPEYEVNWHHKLLCDKLDDFVSGKIKRLLIFMPPQHGKSELVSRRLPAYMLGLNPKLKIVGASYSADLAQSFNRAVQRIIDSEDYHKLFPNTYLNRSNVRNDAKGSYLRNSDMFETVNYKGFYKSVGVGGSLTGTPADIAIIDDPVKDAIEALSPTYRNRTWNWFTDVLLTRLHNDSQILITQTRWHEDDLSGRVLSAIGKTGEQWDILTLPAIKVHNESDYDIREIGEALWAEKHSSDKLKRMRSLSPRTFEALYQQEPKPIQTGGEFYYAFDYSKHVSKVNYDPELPLHITFDFNVRPYLTCNVWQVVGKEARQIDEILATPPNNNSSGAGRLFMEKYGRHSNGVFIYGDPNGKHTDTRSQQGYNDYDLIYHQLAALNPIMRVISSPPALVPRGIFVNSILERNYADITLIYGENCTQTIEDMMYVKQDADGSKIKEKAKNEDGVMYERYGHTSDANDYFFCEFFKNDFSDLKSGGKAPKPLFNVQKKSKMRY